MQVCDVFIDRFVQQMFFLDLGIPLNEESEYAEDNGELEDATEMNEPEIANEQNEAPEDDMSEYEEDGDNESDEEEDTELGKNGSVFKYFS